MFSKDLATMWPGQHPGQCSLSRAYAHRCGGAGPTGHQLGSMLGVSGQEASIGLPSRTSRSAATAIQKSRRRRHFLASNKASFVTGQAINGTVVWSGHHLVIR